MLYTPVRTARAVGYNPFMPSYPHIEQYRTKLQELIEFGGSDNEENIRPAFQNCLDSYCHDHRERLVLIPELKTSPSHKPDGTVKDTAAEWRGASGRPRIPTTTWTPKSWPSSTGAIPETTSFSRTPRPPSCSRTAARRCGWICPEDGDLHRLIRMPSCTMRFRRSKSSGVRSEPVQDQPAHGAGEPAGHRRRRRGGQPELPRGSDVLPGPVPQDHRPRRLSGRRAGDAATAHPHQGHLPQHIQRGPVSSGEQRCPPPG